MRTKKLVYLVFVAAFAANIFAQGNETRQDRWNSFTKLGWHKVDFSKRLIAPAQLKKLDTTEPDEFDEPVSELALLRGVVFGKRGRVFKERSIQDYLETQKWYKPREDYNNSVLTKGERENLDRIRFEEARRHSVIEPGDMRIWQDKLITEDKIGGYSSAELRVLIAEIEAIRGRTFPEEEWLQKYFEERYWYRPDPNYSSAVLNETERRNIEILFNEKTQGRNTAVSIGDMGNFQTVALTDVMLDGLTMMELRMIRNEIWARRGLKFQTPGVRQYFDWRDWYRPLKDQSKVKLNDIERQNVNLILAREQTLRENLGTHLLVLETVENLFTEDLRILRNEIYARHGRIFKDPELQKYFEAQAWYKPDPEFKDDMLNEIEFKNLATILEAQEYAASKFAEFEG